MLNEKQILLKWKLKNKLMVFNVYYVNKDGSVGSIKASFYPFYDEEKILKEMKEASSSKDFKKWLLPTYCN